MKTILLILAIILMQVNAQAQSFKKANEKNGKIFLSLNNGKSLELKNQSALHLLDYSSVHHLVIYSKTERKSRTADQEGTPTYDQISVYSYHTLTKKETKLFTGCLDGTGGTSPSYAESEEFPAKFLCGIERFKLSKDGSTLYFQSDAWGVSPAIHAYNLKDNTLHFFHSGWLEGVDQKGIQITITGIDMKMVNGKMESNGRYTQLCLFNKKGELLKPLQEKEF